MRTREAILHELATAQVKLTELERELSTARWVDKPRIDRRPKIRFLDPPEEAALRAALIARDAEMREARGSANAWRQQGERIVSSPTPLWRPHDTGSTSVHEHRTSTR
jgi:hypothetical protein